MQVRRDVTTTIIVGVLVGMSVLGGVAIGFFGANQFSSGSLPEDVETLTSRPSASTPAILAADVITPTQAIEPATAVPRETPTAVPSATATATASPTPLPTETAAPTATPTMPAVGTLTVTARIALNVRAGPDTSYPVIDPVRNGDTLPVLGQNSNGSWLLVRLPDGREGWLSRGYTDFLPGEQVPVIPTPTLTSGD